MLILLWFCIISKEEVKNKQKFSSNYNDWGKPILKITKVDIKYMVMKLR